MSLLQDKGRNSLVFLFRYLNAAQNKIEKLPPASTCKYNCPMLEEIYLQDNSLEEIPCKIFRLPSLITLDISNNKLERIPFDMWKAPKLRELNIAFNLLKELPNSRDVSFVFISRKCLSYLNPDSTPHRWIHRCFSNTHRPIHRPWRIVECKNHLNLYSNAAGDSNSNLFFQQKRSNPSEYLVQVVGNCRSRCESKLWAAKHLSTAELEFVQQFIHQHSAGTALPRWQFGATEYVIQ